MITKLILFQFPILFSWLSLFRKRLIGTIPSIIENDKPLKPLEKPPRCYTER